MTDMTGAYLRKLLDLRTKLDRNIALECQRQGVAIPHPQPRRGVGYVVLPAPTLADAAEQLAAAAERWGQGRG